jgi:hypothetical protein
MGRARVSACSITERGRWIELVDALTGNEKLRVAVNGAAAGSAGGSACGGEERVGGSSG